jgi:hypothetical protein
MGGFCCCRKSNRKSVINQALIPNEPLIEEKLNTTDAVSIPISDNNLVPNNKDNNIIKTELKEEKPSDDSNTIYSEKGLNLNENIGDDEPLLKANSPLICDYEKERITFTKNGLINLFDKLWVLDNYKCVYDKDNLIIDLRYEGTPMNQKFYLIRMVYKLKKAELKYNKDTDSMMDYCYDLNLRVLWDDALKKYEKYEGTDTAFIVCTWGKSPVFFVSERETIEKRFRFNRGNSTYVMSTSIPLDIYEPKEGVVRFVDFLNLFKISDVEDEIVFTSLNQVDFKMPIPQILINITLPSTSRTWYNNIKKFSNRIIWDRKNKTYELKKEEEED